MPSKWWSYLLAGFGLPWLLTVSLPLLFLLRVCGLVHDARLLNHLVVMAEITPRGARFWHYSTTIGRVIFLQPGASVRILAHELVHVRQHEDLTVIGWVLMVVLDPFFAPTFEGFIPLGGFVLWWSAGLWQLLMYPTAALRYGWKRGYVDAEHERAAYAQTEPDPGVVNPYRSWLKRREAELGGLG